MHFKNRNDFLTEINSFTELGEGAQGICFLDKDKKTVYKIFHEFFDDCEPQYCYNDIMRFSDIKNNTYMFPKNVINVNGIIVGYIKPYVKSKDLTSVNPLKISLDKLVDNINNVRSDIEIISENGVLTYDIMYNIIYKNKITIIDTDDYEIKDLDPIALMERNNYNFDYAIYNFLIDNIFDDFVESYRELRNMYKDKDVDVVIFIELFRKYLSEYIGFEVNKLSDAKKCMNKVKAKIPNYIRDIKL